MSDVSMVPLAAVAALETAINRTLALDPESRRRLQALEGRVIALEIEGTGISLFFLPLDGELQLHTQYEGGAETTLRGTPFALLRMSAGEAGEGLFSGEVTIHGDVELGQRFRRLFERLDIDWEEHLAEFTGDVAAHQIGNLARGLREWGGKTLERLGKDLGEYLQEERQDLPARSEVEEFMNAVDVLRDDSDRLEVRLKRLEKRLGADAKPH